LSAQDLLCTECWVHSRPRAQRLSAECASASCVVLSPSLYELWEPMACHHSSSRRERGAACSGWDSRTWCVLGLWMRGPAGTGRGGVSMAGGREDQGARKGNGERGHRLPSPPCFVQNLPMYFGFPSRWERLLANIHSVYSYTWIVVCFTFISFIYCIVISHLWFCMLDIIIGRSYTWNCQIRTHIHSEIHTHTHTQKPKKEKKRKEKENVTTISKPQSLTSVRIKDCTLRVPNKTTTLFLYE